MKVILASASPRRKELIQNIFDEISVIPAETDEIIPCGMPPQFAPIYLAEQKASYLAKTHFDDLVIAADTIVLHQNKILGKPRDAMDAKTMLRSLSGDTHEVITGCAITLQGNTCSFSVTSCVTFYPLSDEEIEWYVSTGEPMDKAGAYGIQGKGGLFVKKINGDYFNIVGLPIARLQREIRDFLPKE